MEGFNAPEGIPTKEEVMAKLKEIGLTPETTLMVEKWLEDRRTKEKNGIDTAITNIELSDLYLAIRDYDEVESCLSQGMYQARQEDSEEVYNLALKKLVELDLERGI
ncbi:MAG TPA: hypothetical protein PLZ99_02995 [Parcubacteria group bacterium]|jgi:hypothetical protein|nr:hypothetical protein [Parcubacteria group bacterium]